ncbi:ABC-2 type transport system ATP-binding protein [Paenibacillus sophorae]|uniref:ABC-2 type transport system ATP-binding protein n=1 Tax=Paenibacillus sophorae TaxID=1333845 RepID=A0A1H8U717_9BACL|nr:daunorubicin resistance protein DrrA family ABC transporter ATP-binding protein [Paenibacillus sophorae]QWU17963.1 daunorubicin resistance protein DrrA family ABC transporter ATP-binding protein [Paenibacillus sophorae]SEO98634.1 ABC-2 type transport system ATP-binding protein [Paenibacillus sophorae]
MKPLAIEIQNLRKTFGDHTVLHGINLSVHAGTVFALLGPNGAGKTTLIHILSTLVAPDEGTARVAGFDVAAERNEVKRSITLTGQFAAVDDVLTGEENLRMICRLSGLSAADSRIRTAELLKHFELMEAARKRVKTYSGGMRRRLDLAISLAVSRPVMFLDEPTTGLDTRSRRALWDIILQLKEQGITIFLTTQYLEEADQLADTIAVISGGRIVATGSAGELKSRVGGEVIELRNADNEIIRKVPTDGSILDISRTLHELSSTLPGETRVSINRPNMDDVFLAMTGGTEVAPA